MKPNTPKLVFLPWSAALAFALGMNVTAHAASTFDTSDDDGKPQQVKQESDPSRWSRKLWTGAFDRAADASGNAAKQLEAVKADDCNDALEASKDKDHPDGDQAKFQACLKRTSEAQAFAKQAHSIQKQQQVMSLVSKASDVAAVGAVGAVAYAEIGMKSGNQASTYSSAANIEQTAGTAAYVTGAADLTMGAYAYVAQKQKLEQMEKELTTKKDGVRMNPNSAAASSLTGAVEAAKKAAYSHMMWGAGKMAAGYGMQYIARRSQDQAEKMQSIQDDREYAQIMQMRAAQAGQLPAQQVMLGASNTGGALPVYNNNNPSFSLPNNTAASAMAAKSGPVTYAVPGGGSGGTGASAALTPQNARALASAAAGKAGGGGGGAPAGGLEGNAAPADDAQKEKTEKSAKEAMGSSFEMQLTGGMKAYSGSGAPSGGGKDEIPNLSNLMGAMGGTDPTGAKLAGTGLTPAMILQGAQNNGGDDEQGSMAGVSNKSETSLFELNHAKLTKMFQIGNVGIPKDVEVKN